MSGTHRLPLPAHGTALRGGSRTTPAWQSAPVRQDYTNGENDRSFEAAF
ncbi:hypothetical protein [Brevibacillus borstelensis]|jgi:hypothetical protein|nr:hypothetical protein [Brevibacillus borstelensis]WNF03567.1 hypothetical protein RFB14_14060 [Brevibacillus borstelensis]